MTHSFLNKGLRLGDTTAVSAMLDRLLHHAHVLECGPKSYRMNTASLSNGEAVSRLSMLASYSIETPLNDAVHSAIEVVVVLKDGERRLAHFATPEALKLFGDWVPGTKTRFHVGLVIIEELTEGLIKATLDYLDREGTLIEATRRYI